MKALFFGATGTGSSGVLQACHPLPLAHDKLRVFVHSDCLDYSKVAEAFTGVDACIFCLGISVTQTSGEAEYSRITHDFARGHQWSRGGDLSFLPCSAGLAALRETVGSTTSIAQPQISGGCNVV
jgi:hypothetical protein